MITVLHWVTTHWQAASSLFSVLSKDKLRALGSSFGGMEKISEAGACGGGKERGRETDIGTNQRATESSIHNLTGLFRMRSSSVEKSLEVAV